MISVWWSITTNSMLLITSSVMVKNSPSKIKFHSVVILSACLQTIYSCTRCYYIQSYPRANPCGASHWLGSGCYMICYFECYVMICFFISHKIRAANLKRAKINHAIFISLLSITSIRRLFFEILILYSQSCSREASQYRIPFPVKDLNGESWESFCKKGAFSNDVKGMVSKIFARSSRTGFGLISKL